MLRQREKTIEARRTAAPEPGGEDESRPGDPGLRRLLGWPRDRPVALLHSGRYDADWSRHSLLAEPRAWFQHTAAGQSRLIPADDDLTLPDIAWTGHLWRDLRTLLHCDALPGYWVGFIGYDVGRRIEPGKLAADRPGLGDWPLVELGWCPVFESLPAAEPHAASPDLYRPAMPAAAPDLRRGDYEQAIRRVLDYIGAGDVFQVNLAQRFSGEWTGNPRDLFARLATVSPAWFGAYLESPRDLHALDGACPQRALLSTSPELFLSVRGRQVTTRPIKGTRPVSASADELLHSAKDTAELNMIVDLMRNDLGRVCDYGSVWVAQGRTIESHPTIHHGVATVTGDLHASRDIVDLLRATLPGGSITGAPKVRAMQIIDELEPTARGPYCGCIGYLSRDEAMLNIAIRTMQLTRTSQPPHESRTFIPEDEGPDQPTPSQSPPTAPDPHYTVHFHAGGGIVADSDPAAEYEETLDKARAMQTALTGRSSTP